MKNSNKVLTELFNLIAPEVSFVPRGANQIPFLISKEAGVKVEALKKLIADTKLPNSEKLTKVMKSLDENKKDALTASLQVLRVMKEDEDFSEDALGEILGLAEVVEQEDDETKGTDLEEMQKSMIAKDEEIAELKEKIEKMDVDKMDVDKMGVHKMDCEEEGIFKEYITKEGKLNSSAIPEAIRPMVSMLWSDKQKKDSDLATIKKQLDEEREVRVRKEYDDKAATDYGNIKVEGLGLVMKEFGEKSADQFPKLEAILKAANDALGKPGNAFGEVGSAGGGGGPDDGVSADAFYDTIKARAVVVCKEDNPGASDAILVSKFISKFDEGRKMQAEYKRRKLG